MFLLGSLLGTSLNPTGRPRLDVLSAFPSPPFSFSLSLFGVVRLPKVGVWLLTITAFLPLWQMQAPYPFLTIVRPLRFSTVV
jgi:hypothetical protein